MTCSDYDVLNSTSPPRRRQKTDLPNTPEVLGFLYEYKEQYKTDISCTSRRIRIDKSITYLVFCRGPDCLAQSFYVIMASYLKHVMSL